MAKHKTHYVFLVSEKDYQEKMIVEGLNEKEARRNLLEWPPYLEFQCPKVQLLSCHGSFRNALEWRENNNAR